MRAWRNQQGYERQVRWMRLQWDYRINCGIRRARLFVANNPSVKPWPGQPTISIGDQCPGPNAERCDHSWRIGEYASVCQKCATLVKHGGDVPAFGLSDEMRWNYQVQNNWWSNTTTFHTR